MSAGSLGPERKLFFFAMCLGAATKNGHRFLTDTQNAGKGQVLYSEFTKARKPRRRSLPLHQEAAEKIEGQ